MDEIGVGVIGFGFMGKAHTFGYKTIPLYYKNLPFKIKLVGVCTRNYSVAEEAREQNGFKFATDNVEDIFNCKDINVVSICTPNVFHKDMVIGALKAGKHVYCDKPLATSYAEAKEITDFLATVPGLTTQVALQYRFFPATLRAKQLIDEGFLGKVFSFRACYLHTSAVDPMKPIGWKQDKKLGGGGVLFDLGSHVFDLMYHFLGEYDSGYAVTDIVYKQRPDKNGNMIDASAEDQAMAILRMKNGALGTIEVSKVATGCNDDLRFEIHGQKGALRFNLMEPNWLEVYDNTIPDKSLGGNKGFTRIDCLHKYDKPGGEFPSPRSSIGWLRAHVASLYNFISSVYEGKAASPSFNDGAYIQYILDKMYTSADENKWIRF